MSHKRSFQDRSFLVVSPSSSVMEHLRRVVPLNKNQAENPGLELTVRQ